MNTVTLNFRADDQQLVLTGSERFAANTVGYVRAAFDLGDGWDGFDSIRAVWATDFAKIATVLDSDGACAVPWEVLKRVDTVMVNLVGSISDGEELTDRLTTYKVKALDVNGCTNIDGSETAEITPSQFEQFVAIVKEEVGKVKDISDVKLNADYTLTFLFSDGTEWTTPIPIRGEQGAKGDTGNGISSIAKTGASGLVDTYTITYTDGTHSTFTVTNGAKGEQGETGNGIDRIEKTATVGSVDTYTIYFTDGSTTTFTITNGEVTMAQFEKAFPTDTASGSIASFPDGSDLFGMKSLKVSLEPVQDLNGYDAPWVGGAGKNLLSPILYDGMPYNPTVGTTVTLTESATQLAPDDNETFTITLGSTWTYKTLLVPVEKSKRYWITLGLTSSGQAGTIRGYLDENFNILGKSNNTNATQNFNESLLPENWLTGDKGYYYILITNRGTANTTLTITKPMVEVATSATSYAPYSNICPISGWDSVGASVTGVNLLPSDKYQLSQLNVILGQNNSQYNTYLKSGEYTISANSTQEIGIFYRKSDGVSNIRIAQTSDSPVGTFTVAEDGLYRFWAYNSSGITAESINWFQLELGSTVTAYEPYNGTTYTADLPQTVYGGWVDLATGEYNTKPYYASYNGETLTGEWISDRDKYVAGTSPTIGAQVVNIGADGTDGTITPQTIQTLQGTNNVWSDGDVEVEYKADVQLWVEKKLAG